MITGELRSVLQEAPPAAPREALGWLKRLTLAWADAARDEDSAQIVERYARDLLGERAEAIIGRVEVSDVVQRARGWPIWPDAPMPADDPWHLYNLVGLYTQQTLVEGFVYKEWPGVYVHIQPGDAWMVGEDPYDLFERDDIWLRFRSASILASGAVSYDGPFKRWRAPQALARLYPVEITAPLFDATPPTRGDGWSKLHRSPQRFIQLMSVDYFEEHKADLTCFTPAYFTDHHNLESFTESSWHGEFAVDLIRFVEESSMFTVFFDADGWCWDVPGCWGHARHAQLAEVYIDCWE